MFEYPGANIPKDDIAAWQQKPWTRPWFNKLHVAEAQGVECGPHGLYPTKFPVISRPIYNMDGMGAGAEIWHGSEDVNYKPGHFWSEMLEGDHISYDILLEDGEVKECFAALGHKISLSQFSHWEIFRKLLPAPLKGFLDRNFYKKSGKINLECIGEKIIEIHFRWCPEWEHWYPKAPFYSVPLWQDADFWQQLESDSGDEWEVVADKVPGFVAPARLGVMLCNNPNIARHHPKFGRYTIS